MRAIVIGAPVEILELERKVLRRCGQGLQQRLARRNDFLADAVSGNGCNAICLHFSTLGIDE